MGQELERAAKLLQETYAKGEISEDSKNALLAVKGIAADIGGSLGADATSDELLLVTLLVDDSNSIGSNAHAVTFGHNLMLDILGKAKGVEVLAHTRYLNRGVLSPYSPLDTAVRLQSENYLATAAQTPLYRESIVTLGSVMARAREQLARGRRVRTFTLIVTDALDNASGTVTADSVRVLVNDMLYLNTNHIVAAMGIGYSERFHEIFTAMGIPERWILMPDSNEEAIKAKFNVVATDLKLATTSSGFLQLTSGSPSGDA